MSVRPEIPSVEGIADRRVTPVLVALKAIVEMITGRTPNKPQIVKLGANANLSGVINKVNEIIDRLQG